MSELQKVFEHTIDLSDRLSDGVGRKEIYLGLLDFVHCPERYIDALDSAKVSAVDQTAGKVLLRELNFGNFQVTDHVSLIPDELITFEVAEGVGIPQSMFSIAIEAGADKGVLLRFTYNEAVNPELVGQEFLQSLREEAWRSKDVAVVDAVLARFCL